MMLVREWSAVWVEDRYVHGAYGARRASPATMARVEQHLRDWILPVIGDKGIRETTTQDASAVLTTLKVRSPATRNRVLTTMKSMFSDAVIAGIVDIDPTARLRKHREEEKPKVTLSAEQAERVLAALPHDNNGDALRVVAATGARLEEIIGLTWGEVKADGFHLPAARTKERSAKVIFAGAFALSVLGERGADADPVFYNAKERTARRVLWRACDACSAPRICPHGLRYGWARLAEERGASLRQIQTQLHHASARTTERYLPKQAPGVHGIASAVGLAIGGPTG